MHTIVNFLFVYFLFSTLHVLVLSIAGLFSGKKKFTESHAYKKIAILIPAYKEDAVIVSSAKNLLKQDYPKNSFQVVVIADSLEKDTLHQLRELPIRLIEVSFEKSTKALALNKAMSVLEDAFDVAVVSDADNIFEGQFLNKINNAFQLGCTAVQGRRVAKNLNSPFAVLDAYSEAANNHIFRKGANALGISSALIGSGMAFRYQELKEIMREVDAVGGFDRMLQLRLIERGNFIHYLEDAVVYDEKVADPVALENQRRRWNASQYKYLKKYFFQGFRMLFKGNVSYFNTAILNSIFLSRVLNLGFLGIIAVGLSVGNFLPLTSIIAWWGLLLMYVLALLFPLKNLPFKINILETVIFIPKVFLLMLKSSLSIKGADRQFIHTAHSFTELKNNADLDEQGK